MWSTREVVNCALQRRHTLEALRRPQRTLAREDACTADMIPIRSAVHHAEASDVPCPLCTRTNPATLNYVVGDQLGQYSGRIKSTAELDEMQNEFGEFTVRVVEVRHQCGWNHLIHSYLLGDGVKRRPPRRQQTVEDIYG